MLLDTLRAQERQGHEVWVVVPPGGVNYKRLKQDWARTVPLNVRSSKFDYFAAWKLASILREKRIDVLHTHLTSSALLGSAAARWAGVPCVASVLKMTSKRRYMKCEKLLPCSDAVMDNLREQNVPESFMRRVYTGIDFRRYFETGRADENARAEFGFTDEHKVVGVVARLVPMKGNKILLDAFQTVATRHPEARLLIVGDGELRPALEKQAEDLGIKNKTVFAGTRRDLRRILNTIDISVLSSVAKEGLPVILVESVLFSRPVIMSDVAGIREVVSDGETGLLVRPNDAASLADSICNVIENPDAAAERAEAALDFVRREFDVDYTAKQIEDVYKELLANRRKERSA